MFKMGKKGFRRLMIVKIGEERFVRYEDQKRKKLQEFDSLIWEKDSRSHFEAENFELSRTLTLLVFTFPSVLGSGVEID